MGVVSGGRVARSPLSRCGPRSVRGRWRRPRPLTTFRAALAAPRRERTPTPPHVHDAPAESIERRAAPAATRPSAGLEAALGRAIDYAGLFPPAALPMPTAVANHEAYRRGADSWALGRFVVTAARLPELAAAAAALGAAPAAPTAAPWRLAVLLGDDLGGLDAVSRFNAEERWGAVDVVEFRAADEDALPRAADRIPRALTAYAELPLRADTDALVRRVAALGLRAKVRTGGVTADAFPPAGAVVAFVIACTRLSVPFKATAGLHHPLRGEYPLTYAAGSPCGAMYGFINLLLATAVASSAEDVAVVTEALAVGDAGELRVDDTGLAWRGRHWTVDELRQLRAEQFVSFGSCSFTEPLADLAALDLR